MFINIINPRLVSNKISLVQITPLPPISKSSTFELLIKAGQRNHERTNQIDIGENGYSNID
jgi:mRNA-degrading endonuclease toxin of MazEF toxin-antitoxin module